MGSCSANNVSALTLSGGATVDDGLNKLPQKINYPDPEDIDPKPPLDTQNFKKTLGCPSSPAVIGCLASTDGATITPPANTKVYMGNVKINAGAGTASARRHLRREQVRNGSQLPDRDR